MLLPDEPARGRDISQHFPYVHTIRACAPGKALSSLGTKKRATQNLRFALSVQRFEQLLCIDQIRGLKSLAEPAVDIGEQMTRIVAAVL